MANDVFSLCFEDDREYPLPLRDFAYVRAAWVNAQHYGVPVKLYSPGNPVLWLEPTDDIYFDVPDTAEPESLQPLTEDEYDGFMDIFSGRRRYGYWVLELQSSGAAPLYTEPGDE